MRFFKKAAIKHGESVKEKSLGSFFAKLVHTFKPNEYCALDNPIKISFGLQNEGFILSFFIISAAYREWSLHNQNLIMLLKFKLESENHSFLKSDRITDLKLLDMLFWSNENPLKEISTR